MDIHMKPKTRRVYDYLLDGGPATVREMQAALGMTEVRSRISELVSAGVPITKTWETGENIFGEPVRFRVYGIRKEES